MDTNVVPLEGGQPLLMGLNGIGLKRHPKAKKSKKAVLFFEVEILDAKTRDKLCFLDKVGLCPGGWEGVAALVIVKMPPRP